MVKQKGIEVKIKNRAVFTVSITLELKEENQVKKENYSSTSSTRTLELASAGGACLRFICCTTKIQNYIWNSEKTQVGKLRLTSPNIERGSRAGHFDEQVGLIAFANAARIACRFAIFEFAFESLDRVTLFTPLSHFPVHFFNH